MIDGFIELCHAKSSYNQELYDNNRKQILRDYFEEFSLLEGFNDFSYELGVVLDRYIPQPQKPFLQFALLRIHEKGLKIFREAKILMENGSSSGAVARWRTLFELSVVSLTLIKYPDLAQKYILYSKVDDYKVAKKLVEYKDRLNLYHYNMDAFPEIEAEYNRLCAEYGWTGKNNYEWAKNNDIKNPNLFELARNIGQEHFYAYVDESHMYNHPSARYLLHDRGEKAPDDDDTYLFSPFEMDLPMQLITISLFQINCAAISGYSVLEFADKEQLSIWLENNDEFPKAIIEMFESRSESKEEQHHAD